MKKHTRILSLLLAMIMVFSLFPVSAFATETGTPAVVSQQLNLGDDLTMHFHVTAEENTVVNATVNGNTTQHDLSQMAPDSNGQYVIAVKLAAAQMTEAITLDFLQNDVSVLQKTYSVRDYAVAILEGNYPENTKNMVLYMLGYGAAAQNYFGVNTGALANAGYNTEAVQLPTEYEAMAINGAVDGMRFYGASLVFENQIAVRYYFKADSTEGVTFTANGARYNAVAKNGMHYVEIPGINPQDYAKSITLTAAKGEEKLSVSYSPLNYIIRMSEKGSTELKTLLNALYGYHSAAVEYVKRLSQEGAFFGAAGGYTTTNGFDISKDQGENATIQAVGNAPQYAFVHDVFTDKFCFETQINVSNVLNNDSWPKFGLLVNGSSEMVKFFVDMTPAMTATHVGVVYQPTGGGDDWAGAKSVEVPGMSFTGSDTIKLKLIRDGRGYYFYVNDVLVLRDNAGFKAETGAVGMFSFNTELTASNYSVLTGEDANDAIHAAKSQFKIRCCLLSIDRINLRKFPSEVLLSFLHCIPFYFYNTIAYIVSALNVWSC